jgi:hypothetical protein
LACICPFAVAQSNQEWIAYKQKCGIPANTAYNDWVAAGAKCNSQSSTVPAGLTPQQQLGTAIGKVGADMLSQGIHNLFYGQPLDPATQQRALAAQQLNNSGVYLMGQHNYSGAINEFQKALALTPNDPLIKRNLYNATETQKQSAVAGRTSDALGNLLNTTSTPPLPNVVNQVNLDPNVVDFRGIGSGSQPPASRSYLSGDNANRLQTVITGSDSSVVDLSHSAKVDPKSLKTQIDVLFGAPVPPPATSPSQSQEIDEIFQQPDQNTNSKMDQSQNLTRSPTH